MNDKARKTSEWFERTWSKHPQEEVYESWHKPEDGDPVLNLTIHTKVGTKQFIVRCRLNSLGGISERVMIRDGASEQIIRDSTLHGSGYLVDVDRIRRQVHTLERRIALCKEHLQRLPVRLRKYSETELKDRLVGSHLRVDILRRLPGSFEHGKRR